ncbi:metallopeptidase family protein [Oceaniglobus ichthyenteri]|uniref:metallopeptidase family protein n=1 Tax=Oceaniglobus ichthyenteri TaxID=2136177 RepID=UPI000D3AC0CE|nr:metallopeptidase family protein [Oceaniglobus ichthyenteri]
MHSLIAPDINDFATLAEAARAALPADLRDRSRDVVLRIEDFAPDSMLRAMDIDDPFSLTGLYDGIPLTEKSFLDQPHGPDVIWLFRRPILDEWVARGNISLGEIVTHVLIHEMAHHFGWSDGDIAQIDRWWE